MIDVTAADEISDDARARSNVVRLAAAQALTGANSAVIFATGSIVGATLAPDVSLATVPLSMFVLGLATGTLPTGAISRAYGRRVAFIIGTGFGVLTGLLGALAILRGSFALFCCATFLGGLYGAVSQSYRFAAADGASAGVSSQGRVLGDGRRRFRRRAGPATRAVDDGYLAALPVRFQFPDAGRGGAGGDGDTLGSRCAETRPRGPSWRPPVAGDRAAATVHRRGHLRHRCLSDHEPGDDVSSAGDEDLRPERQRFQFRHPVAYRCHVRAQFFHRLADRAFRRAEGGSSRPAAGGQARRPSDCRGLPRCTSGPR